ncbi:MAG: class I SAM-dependent methyltransferase [Candidatus Parcubacteria bacterium]|nr:class I SAM-dependent methyltransferase [Candidatus Parcubacteria bacterium]
MNYWKKIKKNDTPSTSGILDEFVDKLNSQSKVFEVGCGYGRIIDKCISKKSFIYGIDINKNEIDALKLKYADYENVSLEVNDITDRNFKLKVDYKFDYVFLNGLLGALKLEQRMVALKNVLKIIHSNSIIHLSEFLIFEKNKAMKDRYLKDFPETGEYGTFFVCSTEGEKIYQTHNFSQDEIKTLVLKDFKIIKKELLDFKSYTGKIKPGIILLLQIKNK